MIPDKEKIEEMSFFLNEMGLWNEFERWLMNKGYDLDEVDEFGEI